MPVGDCSGIGCEAQKRETSEGDEGHGGSWRDWEGHETWRVSEHYVSGSLETPLAAKERTLNRDGKDGPIPKHHLIYESLSQGL